MTVKVTQLIEFNCYEQKKFYYVHIKTFTYEQLFLVHLLKDKDFQQLQLPMMTRSHKNQQNVELSKISPLCFRQNKSVSFLTKNMYYLFKVYHC